MFIFNNSNRQKLSNVEWNEVQIWQVCAKKGFLQLILLRDKDIMVYKEILMLQDITSQNSQISLGNIFRAKLMKSLPSLPSLMACRNSSELFQLSGRRVKLN